MQKNSESLGELLRLIRFEPLSLACGVCSVERDDDG
jgi:hypothetical protein